MAILREACIRHLARIRARARGTFLSAESFNVEIKMHGFRFTRNPRETFRRYNSRKKRKKQIRFQNIKT